MKKSSRGFTLIETCIATAVLVVGSVAIASLFVNSVKVNIGNRERTNATVVLIDKLEELKISLPANGEYSDAVSLSDGTTLLREWRLSGTDLRTITITVRSNDHHSELLQATTMAAPSW